MLPAAVAHAKPPAAAKAAKQPVGVGQIAGPQGAKVRARVLKIMRAAGTYEVTDVEDVKPGSSPESYEAMAKGTQSDAIIVGTVSKAMNLTLSIYGANGARVDALQIKGGTFAKLFKAIDNELEIALADPLAKARPGGSASAAAAAPAAAPTPPPPPVKRKLAPGEEEDEEEADVDDLGKGKAKAKPAKKEPAKKTKPAADELESEDVDARPPDEKEDEPESSGDSTAEEPSEPAKTGLRPLELLVGFRAYKRDFAYTGLTAGGLVPYNLPLAPKVVLAARFYPGAMFGNGALSHIGIMARYELGFGATTDYAMTNPVTKQQTITKLKTSSSEYQFGLRGRLPVGNHELGVFGVYGVDNFALVGDESPLKVPYALVPDVHYHYVRVGLDMRLYISKLLVSAQIAPRFLTSMKEMDKARVWFPGATGSGLDFGLMLGWKIFPWLTPVAGLDVVRYGFDFNNLPTTPPPRVIAGGATDTYSSLWVGALANFDFAGSSGAGGASVEAKPSEEPAAKDDSADEDSDDDAPPKKPAKKAAKKPAPSDEEEEEE